MKQNSKIYESPALTSDIVSVDAGFCESTKMNACSIEGYLYETDEDW